MSSSPHRSFESLRKEAKRWLRELHAGDSVARERFRRALPNGNPSTATLREVQHALAREQGYDGWTALKQATTAPPTVPRITVAQYQEMAEALLEAFHSGTPEAMERHYRYTWHRRPWSGMRSYVLLDLGRRPDDAATISVAEARQLVAHEYGFSDWTELERYVAAAPVDRPLAAKPVRANGTITREWSVALELLANSSDGRLEAHGQLTDALLREVVRCPGITSLNLGGSRGISEEGFALLARLPGLRHLDLSGTAISDRALAVLEELTELESLALLQTPITDAGMVHLRHCEQLRSLNLMWTRAGDGAITALVGKEHFTHLTSGQAVTDAGLAALKGIPAYATWRGGREEMGLTSYEAGPNFLNLRGPFTDRGMAEFRNLPGLFALNVDAGELGITAEGLRHLVDLPQFGWLATDARDESMPVVAAMPHLKFLGCQDSTASDAGWAALGASRSIEYIWGRRCHGLRNEGFRGLSRIPTLKALSVSCLNVEDSAIALLPQFPALRELMPMDVPDAGYRHIGQCEQLESLVLMYCRDTTDAAMEHLRDLRNLRTYFVSYNLSTDRTPEVLSRIESLEDVTLDGCAGVTDAGIQQLRRLPRLRKVRAAGNRITAAAGSGFGPTVSVSIN